MVRLPRNMTSPMVAPSRGTSFMVVGIHHRDAVLGGVAHALARLELRALVRRQRVPVLVPRADRRRAVDLGQAVDMGDAEILLLQRLQHGGRAAARRRS